MADYTTQGGGSAADQLDAGEGTGEGHDANAEAGREDTFFLPPDFPGADGLKAGDMLPPMRVVGKDAQGGVEAEIVPPSKGGKPPWRQDLESSMAAPPTP